MPQLTKGAAQALQMIADHARVIRYELDRAHDQAKRDPEYTRDRINDALQALRDLEDTVEDKVRPLLERQAPEYEKRLADVERRLAELEDGRVVRLRREA